MTDSPKLWLVRRSANARTHRGPRLYWLAIASKGPKQITLVKPYCGRIVFQRSALDTWDLAETPEAAMELFRERAQHWRAIALEDLGRADRDLAFVEHRTIEDVLRHAKEEVS